MSKIRSFRINGEDNVAKGIEFYFKAENENDGRMICNFCVADDGIWYYRTGSKILSRKENRSSRNSADGFISMETLNQLFEALRKAGLGWYEYAEENPRFAVTRSRKQIILEPKE